MGGFVPFLDHDVEIYRIICSTIAIEPIERPQLAVKARGHFPHNQATINRALHSPAGGDP